MNLRKKFSFPSLFSGQNCMRQSMASPMSKGLAGVGKGYDIFATYTFTWNEVGRFLRGLMN